MPTTEREKTLAPSFPFLPPFPLSLDSLVLLQPAKQLLTCLLFEKPVRWRRAWLRRGRGCR